jgi:hypothetical protein
MNTLQRLRELEAKATPRPWAVAIESGDAFLATEDCSESVMDTYTDLEFVAEMRNALPALLKLIDTIKWCDENDEPVSGYIMDALAALEDNDDDD